jgi:putative FmdB family regulatory protein
MTAREFRCRECGYPFKTADQGWARDAALMCPACGSADVSILVTLPQREAVRMAAVDQETVALEGRSTA